MIPSRKRRAHLEYCPADVRPAHIRHRVGGIVHVEQRLRRRLICPLRIGRLKGEDGRTCARWWHHRGLCKCHRLDNRILTSFVVCNTEPSSKLKRKYCLPMTSELVL